MTEPPQIARSTDESTVRAGLRRPSSRTGARREADVPTPYTQRFRTATAVLVGFAIGRDPGRGRRRRILRRPDHA